METGPIRSTRAVFIARFTFVACLLVGGSLAAAGFSGWPNERPRFDSEGEETATDAETVSGVAITIIVVSPIAFLVVRFGLDPQWRRQKNEHWAAIKEEETRAAERDAERDAAVKRTRAAEAAARRERRETVGTDEWKRYRYSENVRQVREETGVRWNRSLYSGARNTWEREARSLMNRFRAEDRATIARDESARRDERLRRATVITTPRSAEVKMASWLRSLGVLAIETSSGADGGIDIEAPGVVGQVKFWTSKKVGRPELQRLQGASDGRFCLFFAFEDTGYSAPAIEWAADTGIGLFVFDLDGRVHSHNDDAHDWLATTG